MRKLIKYVLPVLTFAAGIAGKSLYDANQEKQIDQKYLKCELEHYERIHNSLYNIESALHNEAGYYYSLRDGVYWHRDVIIGIDTIMRADMDVLHKYNMELFEKNIEIRHKLNRINKSK